MLNRLISRSAASGNGVWSNAIASCDRNALDARDLPATLPEPIRNAQWRAMQYGTEQKRET